MFTRSFKGVAPWQADLRAEEYKDDRQHGVSRSVPRPLTPAGAEPGAAAAGPSVAAGMMIYLSAQEKRLLKDLLDARVIALQHEIHHTDSRTLRLVLRAELNAAGGIAARLEDRRSADPPPAQPVNKGAH